MTTIDREDPRRPGDSWLPCNQRRLHRPISASASTEVTREYSNIFKLDIQAVNEASCWQLPIPARFVIDGSGVIRDVKADPDYRYRPEPSEVFDIVKKVLVEHADMSVL